MSLSGSLHVYSDDAITVVQHKDGEWLRLFDCVPVYVDDASTADRLSEAFARLAKLMRKRAHIPEPDLFEALPSPVDAELMASGEVTR